MEDVSRNNTRLAKNTLVLYVRMIIMMIIGLFTSRVIFNALGVSDYGLYNVTSSVITMFGFIDATLFSGTQRFMSFSLGRDNSDELKSVFKTSMTIYLGVSVLILILAETAGLWYVNHCLKFPQGQYTAAMWCYQVSIISTIIGLLQVPFSAALIAHERMGAFAYLAIFDVAFKLLVAITVFIAPYHRLIIYSSLMLVSSMVTIFITNRYCRRHFEECGFHFGYDKTLFHNILTFSGWNIIGSMAVIGQGSGINLMINYFYNSAVNGARGIAMQANTWITRFIQDFQMAVNPQIVKYYSSDNIPEMEKLVVRAARYSSFLYLFLGIPLFINIEWVLELWLGSCPEYAPLFLRIAMIETLFRTMGNPTTTAMHATGKMKWVQITAGPLQLSSVILAFVLFKMDVQLAIVILASIYPWILVIPLRLYWVRKYSGMNVGRFNKEVMAAIPVYAVLLFSLPYLTYILLPDSGFGSVMSTSLISVIWSSGIIYFIALEKPAKEKLNSVVCRKLTAVKNLIIK
ncbi:lipopolysaccharide biosynthesis protein [Alistipes provencensis]|uniref:lipopolysaccharide biosynthesis protein n=1 Tax=Alistipes provencensis TaxID=1816676 RepID=UPI0007ECD5A0|nr:hypothetical protein [Alistipes provencensis]